MKLSYSGQEQVRASPAVVWAFVQDPERVARCLPDVQEVIVHDARHMDVTVRVGVGLIRGTFRLSAEVQSGEPDNRVDVRVRGGGLGNALDLTASATVMDNGDGTSTLNWTGATHLRGPVARASARLLETHVQHLIRRTLQNLRREVETSAGLLA